MQSVNTIVNSESFHDINDMNNSSLVEYIQQFDSDYLSFLNNDTLDLSDHPYGGGVGDNYSPFVVSEVKSSVIDSCTPIHENDSCYVVNSSISVMHHPILFTEESVSLVVTDSSKSYFNESERIRYNAYELEEVFATITVTLVGVGDLRVMDDEEVLLFEGSLLQFFNNELLSGTESGTESGTNDKSYIRVVIVKVLSQILVEPSDRSNDSSVRRTEEANLNDTVEVTVSVDGVYLPPPYISFDQVLVETFDDEGDDDFIEILNRDADAVGERYFNPVNSVIVNIIDEDKQSSSILGILLGLVGGVAGFVIILFSYAYLRKSMRKHRGRNLTTQLTDHHRKKIDKLLE